MEGISARTSNLETPMVIDNKTAHMCQFGVGRSEYARVLIEFDAKK